MVGQRAAAAALGSWVVVPVAVAVPAAVSVLVLVLVPVVRAACVVHHELLGCGTVQRLL